MYSSKAGHSSGSPEILTSPIPQLAEAARSHDRFPRDRFGAEGARAEHGRRSVLKWALFALSGAVAFGVDLRTVGIERAFAAAESVNLGTGDFGVLNYAYALEQLEADGKTR